MIKAKNMMYVQDLEHLPFQDLTECLNYIEKELEPTRYAGIVHDKDIDENGLPIKPHIHVMLQFENARSLNNVAKLLKEQPQYIEQWKGDSTNGYSYLIHATTNAHDQYQYEVDEVIANFDYKNLITSTKATLKYKLNGKDEQVIKLLLDRLGQEEITKEEMEEQLTGSQYAKAKPRIDIVHQQVMKRKAEKWREHLKENNLSIDVIWINGASGLGKTRIAKDFASKKDKEYFITGSSRDPFQHYQGQETIIIDELRPSTFQYSDLLKMLDPFNDDVMIPSRYFDKALTASTIIITSPYTPKNFYLQVVDGNNRIDLEIDSFKQLARRLTLVLYLDEESIYSAVYDDKWDNFILEKSTKGINPYIEKNKEGDDLQKRKANELYKHLLHEMGINEKKADL